MKLFKTKLWPPFELAIFKWSCILFGVIVGAFFAPFVIQYLWIIIGLTVLGSARVTYFYYFKKDS
jgi:hypothetical protein